MPLQSIKDVAFQAKLREQLEQICRPHEAVIVAVVFQVIARANEVACAVVEGSSGVEVLG